MKSIQKVGVSYYLLEMSQDSLANYIKYYFLILFIINIIENNINNKKPTNDIMSASLNNNIPNILLPYPLGNIPILALLNMVLFDNASTTLPKIQQNNLIFLSIIIPPFKLIIYANKRYIKQGQ